MALKQLFNPLTTDDTFWHHKIFSLSELAQSILKIGSVLAERVGQGKVMGALLWLTVHGYSCSYL